MAYAKYIRVKGPLLSETTAKYCHGHIVCTCCLAKAALDNATVAPCTRHCKASTVRDGINGVNDWSEQYMFETFYKCSACGHEYITHYGVRSEECAELRLGSTDGPHPRLADHLYQLATAAELCTNSCVLVFGLDDWTTAKWKQLSAESRKLHLLQGIANLGKSGYLKTIQEHRFDWIQTIESFKATQQPYLGRHRCIWPPKERRGPDRFNTDYVSSTGNIYHYRIGKDSQEHKLVELLQMEWDFVHEVQTKLEEVTRWKSDSRGKGTQQVELNSINRDRDVIAPVPKGLLVEFEAMRMFSFICAASLGLFKESAAVSPIAAEVAKVFSDDPLEQASGERALFEHAGYFGNDNLNSWKCVHANVDHQNDYHFDGFHNQLRIPKESSVLWFPVELNNETLLLEKLACLEMSRGLVAIWTELIEEALDYPSNKGKELSWAHRLGNRILPELHRQLSILFSISAHKSPNYQGLYVEPLYLEKVELLGQGRFGKVYEVRNGNVRLALKEIDLSQHAEPGQVIQSEQYVATTSYGFTPKSHHSLTNHFTPCICWVNCTTNKFFILMPAYKCSVKSFVESASLSLNDQFAEARIAYRRLLSAFIMFQVSAQLCGVHACNLIHGDLHAGNVLLDEDYEVAAIDFGLSYKAAREAGEVIKDVGRSVQVASTSSGSASFTSDTGDRKRDMCSLAALYEYLLGGVGAEVLKKDEARIISRWRSTSQCGEDEAEQSRMDLIRMMVNYGKLLITYEHGAHFHEKLPLFVKNLLDYNSVTVPRPDAGTVDSETSKPRVSPRCHNTQDISRARPRHTSTLCSRPSRPSCVEELGHEDGQPSPSATACRYCLISIAGHVRYMLLGPSKSR